MRSIGAKPSFLAKTIIAEGLDMGLKSGIPGVALAVIFSVYFLVPEAAVPSIFYLPVVIGATLLSLVLVVVLASIPVYLVFNSKSDLRVTEFSV
jgi:ABC-type antimicrobial peptide transport system permease subunit